MTKFMVVTVIGVPQSDIQRFYASIQFQTQVIEALSVDGALRQGGDAITGFEGSDNYRILNWYAFEIPEV